MSVYYEWTLELIEAEHGDIVESEFADTLASSHFDMSDAPAGHYYELGIVRANDDDCEKQWAYCSEVDGKLVLAPCWNNGIKGLGDMPNWKTPKKFHQELARWQK